MTTCVYVLLLFLVYLDKHKTPKEEARDLQLQEEASVREKVMKIQKNLSLLLKALGEMAITNPVFTHSELTSVVSVSLYVLDSTYVILLLSHFSVFKVEYL